MTINRKKVIIFVDSDKDDLYSLNLLVAQHYFGSIEIIGIICDDAFLQFPRNVSLLNFWLRDVLKILDVDVYKGIDRDNYLKQQRSFPQVFTESFITIMTENFGYDPNVFPSFKNLDNLIDKIRNCGDIYVLTTANLSTLNYLLNCHGWIKNKIKAVYSMIGNYAVRGNVLPCNFLKPYVVPDSEYNAYLDPDAFSEIVRLENVNIIPLDCTNFAPLNQNTINHIKKISKICKRYTTDPFILNNYNNFIKLTNLTRFTDNSKLYMWDTVATAIFLCLDINQKYIERKIDVSWTGKIINGRYKNIIYYSIDYSKFIESISLSLFVKI